MSIQQKLAIVAAAESDCALRRATVSAAWRGLKKKTEVAATPPRIVVAGLALGFLGGLGTSSSSSAGSSLTAKLVSSLIESGVTSVAAALSAGTAAATAVQDAAAQTPPAPQPSAGPPPASGWVRPTSGDTVP